MANPDSKSDRDASLSQSDLASDIMGNNQLQGDDQASVHNQRHAVPNVKQDADSGPVESAKMLDKDVRAKAELGKGNRDGGTGDDK
ncbi:hypothetical protein RDV64_13570 [Acuticoccus sp. MNP-M23]|uniref:hypothetical protein n=1 Tax=Acuticoccus sp. MNP-M23 TaxID=3072793 RepID=UPI002814E43B|nr:hypothetical protein [Acuticoccus sp. MNP-M23]WMS41110.1 hypothetical protein RDV64_13570 [Acuticoccus sp. MNP-M23]